MKGFYLGVILAFAASTAFAGNNNNQNNSDTINNYGDTNTYNQPQGGTGIGVGVGIGGQGGKGGNAEADAVAVSGSKADATAIGVQGQSQKATAVNEGNKQDTKVTVAFNEAKQRLQAPGHAVGGSNATAICVVPIYAGVSVPGASASFGTTVRDEICTLVQYGKEFMAAGAAGSDLSLFSAGYEMVQEAARRVAEMYLPKPGADQAKVRDDTFAAFTN